MCCVKFVFFFQNIRESTHTTQPELNFGTLLSCLSVTTKSENVITVITTSLFLIWAHFKSFPLDMKHTGSKRANAFVSMANAEATDRNKLKPQRTSSWPYAKFTAKENVYYIIYSILYLISLHLIQLPLRSQATISWWRTTYQAQEGAATSRLPP